MNIHGIIFDLDGTLTYYSIDLNSLRNELIMKIKNLNFPLNIISPTDYPISMIRKVRKYMKDNSYPEIQVKQVTSILFKIVEKYELIAADKTSLIPGALDALNYVHSIRLKCGLYTLCGRRPTIKILKRFNLVKYFNVIVTRDDVENFKPHPEHLLKAIEALSLKPSQVIVVGDSVIDVECAKTLGSIIIAVLSGVRTFNELKSKGADYIINSIAELPSLLKSILNL